MANINSTVLLYHDIIADGQAPRVKGSIPVGRLCEHLDHLEEAGFEFVSLSRVFEALEGKNIENNSSKRIALTFDDALEGVYRFGDQFLPRISYRASIFILTDCVGRDNQWNTRSAVISKHMTLPMLQELRQLGCDLQLHGVDHHNLAKFGANELRDRFARGIAWFEQQLGYRPKWLSYPYGEFNAEIANVASEYFEGAVSVNHGDWRGAQARFGLNRISVPYFVDGPGLLKTIEAPAATRWLELEMQAPWSTTVG